MESVLLLVFFYISVLASFSTVAYSRPGVGLLRVGCLIKDVEEATTSACEASLCSDMPFSLPLSDGSSVCRPKFGLSSIGLSLGR